MAANPFKMTVGQIRAKRRSAVHNVGGIRGLAVQIDGAIETQRALAMLPAAVQRRVMRGALAAAAAPVRAAMKKGAAQYGDASDRNQSIGTTVRSLVIKVATSKRDPSKAYALIGAQRGFAEIARIDQSGKVLSMRRRRRGKKLKPGVYQVKGRELKNISSQARKARLDPKSGLIQRRKPSRYLHLIELGGKRRRLRKGNFMDKAARSTAGSAVTEFERNFATGMAREFNRMAAK